MENAALRPLGRLARLRLAPTLVAFVLAAFALVVGLLIWSGDEADRIARSRDESIVSRVIQQSVERIAQLQESSTVWDDAVLETRRRPLDNDWIDLNLGLWFHDYAGFDEVYILDPADRPIYAMHDARRGAPESYIAVEAAAAPLVAQMRSNDPSVHSGKARGSAMLSRGVWDLAILRGRPAVISLKPIVTDSGDYAQAMGTEYLHVAVAYLDDAFFSRLGHNFGLSKARFQSVPTIAWDEATVPLHDHARAVVGYFVWKPFAPGRQVTRLIAPLSLTVLTIAALIIYGLASRLVRRTVDLEESRRHAQHQAMHDGLTGLANRAMFETRLDELLAFSRRHDTLLGLIYVDLDRFKQVNDTHGHPVGDALIRQVAQRLVREVRGYDIVARLGGDEFAIIVTQPDTVAAIERICARIVAELERPFDLSGVQTYISGSLGVAVAPEHGISRTEITRKADIALYKAKMDGRDRYVFFTPDLDEIVRHRDSTNRELRQALASCDEQLRVHYQPICCAQTGEITGVEALLRWQHPIHGLMSPAGFIQAAEECGLIEVLGNWVLRKALADAREWPGLRLAVNVSPIQVRNRAFPDVIGEMLAASGWDPTRLELEITETALMTRSQDVAETLARLRELGVSCALDDFGTGYSSLSHIRDIAVDRIKIDRSFVNAVESRPGAALVEAIANLARANGLLLTAEGVETQAQFEFLRAAGCHEMQGYLLSRPVPAHAITRMLESADTRRLIAIAA
ncbi:putative bifunctional diguanylate cyclase/phosphodiesterase [Novosphingobium colocasiae]|uniref:Bifunctional diguanylate cyclase/phosphodiesterase n=1 Tax=Novosphingobium colocasiae TaxID=1256513 RepID=A0A918UJI8_9SPHN|nr:EAL domain-containing protein [Novosphingobium colocasiae]GGZ14786.1 bifunctional diguanylate cyclase/phosphodiesterase [Novosphingobium colocasiae]